jgi:hypothetical protein
MVRIGRIGVGSTGVTEHFGRAGRVGSTGVTEHFGRAGRVGSTGVTEHFGRAGRGTGGYVIAFFRLCDSRGLGWCCFGGFLPSALGSFFSMLKSASLGRRAEWTSPGVAVVPPCEQLANRSFRLAYGLGTIASDSCLSPWPRQCPRRLHESIGHPDGTISPRPQCSALPDPTTQPW